MVFLLPTYKTGRYFFVVLRWSMAYGFGGGRRFTGIKSCGGGRLAIGDGELSEELLAAAYVGGGLRVRGCQRGCGGMCGGSLVPCGLKKRQPPVVERLP